MTGLRREGRKTFWVILLPVWLTACLPAAAADFQRSFTVDDIERTRRVTVHIQIPPAATNEAPILVVMHGDARNAKSYHNTWRPLAAAYRAILVTPEFSAADWPRSRHYQQGNLQTVDHATKPRAVWSFTAMEQAVDIAAALAGVSRRKFLLYGHSAGAQFVHRYVMVTGGERLIRAVAANAGWYSWPSTAKDYPYGVAPVEKLHWDWKPVFGTELTILLGEMDNDPDAKALRRGSKVMFQGPHRLARGRGFFRAARDLADTSHVPFRWSIATVPDTGHSNPGMAGAAAKILFQR